ncbi:MULTISPECIES: DUF3861 family protein [unclassified Rhizobium]|uniref:DUF3861 family protein n=1 Tax=unclassified Rhizobium TaxID=2613769 RepID=UPI00247A9680|nr:MULTISPECIES: DUF3861 family protein [unclassified Rhizobium]MDH7804530.1 hypothetical protein [Rhizobium sp. AN70]
MAFSSYTYEVSVKLVRGRDGHAPDKAAYVTFEHNNHDDIIAIVDRMRGSSGLAPEAAAAVALGTKLLGEVMLKEKHNPLFNPLRAGFHAFITALKNTPTSERTEY